MIPRTIHYCWFGKGNKPELTKKCIKSWEYFMPDYKIIEWNEDNFDVNKCIFTKEAYEKKKWAFVSDFVRMYALKKYGGIYLDTDVEVLKSFNPLLNSEAFFGFESKEFLCTAVIGAASECKVINDLIKYYTNSNFITDEGALQTLPNPYKVTDILEKYGLKRNGKRQTIDNMEIYPQIYFSPNNLSLIWKQASKNSYAVHYFDQSWRTEDYRNLNTVKGRLRHYCVGKLVNTIGIKKTLKIKSAFHG